MGQALNNYWEQKKIMAPGCEPAFVRRMMDAFAPVVHGQALAGAGGGGFMYVITKEPRATAQLQTILATMPDITGVQFYPARIDSQGLVVREE